MTGEVPTEYETVPSLLEYWSNVKPENPAFVIVGEQTRNTLSRRDVYLTAGKMSARLRRLGISKGDVVANMLPNSSERLVFEFGILMVGAVSQTGFGYLSNACDTVDILNVARTSVIIADPQDTVVTNVLKKMVSSFKETNYGLDVQSSKLTNLKKVIYSISENGKILIDELEEEPEIFIEEIAPNDPAAIIATSGTCGVDKQILQTHASLVRYGRQMCYLLGQDASPFFNNRFTGWFPGYPCVYACSGVTRVMLDARADDQPDIYDVIVSEGCRSAYLVPSEIEEVMNSLEKNTLGISALEVVLTGGQPISKKSMKIVGPLTKSVVCRYGMSEAMCVCSLVVGSQEEYLDHCVGYPMPSYKVKVVDDGGNDVNVGQQGSILVKGNGLFNGYLSTHTTSDITEKGDCNESVRIGLASTKTRGQFFDPETFTSDGWFKTDDIGYFDSQGRLFVHGRGSDAIMHGDEILYPFWLEDLIRKSPDVDDVCVVPVRDAVMCHNICACVILTRENGESGDDVLAEVKKFVRRQFAVHSYDESTVTPQFYLSFEDFPLNRNHKLNRKKLSMIAETRI